MPRHFVFFAFRLSKTDIWGPKTRLFLFLLTPARFFCTFGPKMCVSLRRNAPQKCHQIGGPGFQAFGLDETHVFLKTCVSPRPNAQKSVTKLGRRIFRRLASTKRTFSSKCTFRRGQTPKTVSQTRATRFSSVWPRRNAHFLENVRFVEAKCIFSQDCDFCVASLISLV